MASRKLTPEEEATLRLARRTAVLGTLAGFVGMGWAGFLEVLWALPRGTEIRLIGNLIGAGGTGIACYVCACLWASRGGPLKSPRVLLALSTAGLCLGLAAMAWRLPTSIGDRSGFVSGAGAFLWNAVYAFVLAPHQARLESLFRSAGARTRRDRTEVR